MTELNKNQIIWRYLSLDKFLDLILNRTITLTPYKKASDQNEVSWILDSIDERNEHLRSSVNSHIEILKDYYFISCWTKSDFEKISLWRHYLGKDGLGVAIKSTYAGVQKGILWDSYMMKEVIYKSELKFEEEIESDRLLYTKYIAYKDEEEVRFIVNHPRTIWPENSGPVQVNAPPLMKFNIDIDTLIDEIVISPYCKSWQRDLIRQLINAHCPILINRIQQSTIKEEL